MNFDIKIYQLVYFYIFLCVSKADRTRQYIIQTTAPLFNAKGFHGTSLSDLVDATGLTKGSLYGNFKDKEEISAAAFRYSIGKVKALVKTELSGVTSYKKQLQALLDFYSRYVFDSPIPGGCPLLNTAVEADDDHISMRRAVTKEIVSTVDFISTLIRKGILSGEFKRDTKSKELAYSFFCAIEGAIMFARVERSREPMDIIIKHCKNILEQISK